MPENDNSLTLPEESQFKPKTGRRVWPIIILVIAAATLMLLATRERHQPNGVSSPAATTDSNAFEWNGKRLSTLELQPLDGSTKNLSLEDLRGKVSLINLWGPWCRNCRVEMPQVDRLREQFAEHEDFSFLSVSCSADLQTEDIESLRQETVSYLTGEGYDFPVYFDPRGTTRIAIARMANLLERGLDYPFNIVLDRSGIVRGVWRGQQANLESEIGVVLTRELKE